MGSPAIFHDPAPFPDRSAAASLADRAETSESRVNEQFLITVRCTEPVSTQYRSLDNARDHELPGTRLVSLLFLSPPLNRHDFFHDNSSTFDKFLSRRPSCVTEPTSMRIIFLYPNSRHSCQRLQISFSRKSRSFLLKANPQCNLTLE